MEIRKEAIYNLTPDAVFLNFIYTKTLEEAYGVPDARILYIHNIAIDEISNLILGHGREFTEEFSLSARVDEDTDPRVADGFFY